MKYPAHALYYSDFKVVAFFLSPLMVTGGFVLGKAIGCSVEGIARTFAPPTRVGIDPDEPP